MTEISQVLRSVQVNNSVAFFIGLSRLVGEQELDRLKSNLTYRPASRERFSLYELERIFVPDNTTVRPSIWSQEVTLLKSLRRRFYDQRDFPEETVDERIAEIQAAEGTKKKGLRNHLFLPDFHGNPLKLRPNFAFLKFKYTEGSVTQAEVFFVIACILHNLRHSSSPYRVILQQEFKRVVIDPKTFNRLNDGAVQAALLRSCLPPELDFRVEPQLSVEMADFLIEIFETCVVGQLKCTREGRNRRVQNAPLLGREKSSD